MEKESITNIQLLSWLGIQEESHKFIVYEADARNSAWTRRCIRQVGPLLLLQGHLCPCQPLQPTPAPTVGKRRTLGSRVEDAFFCMPKWKAPHPNPARVTCLHHSSGMRCSMGCVVRVCGPVLEVTFFWTVSAWYQ